MKRLLFALSIALPLLLPFTVEAALTDNLNAYWKLDESSGNAADATGNGNTLTNNGSATFSSGVINNAAHMVNASTQYFSISDNSSLSITGDMTINLWVKFDSLPSGGNTADLACKVKNSTNNISYCLQIYNDGSPYRIRAFVSSNGADNDTDSEVWSPSTGIWYQIAFVYTAASSKYQIYVNGSQLGSDFTGSRTSIFDGNAAFELGSGDNNSSGARIDGWEDEVGIWSRALSPSEITTLYNGGSGLQYPFPISSCRYSGSGDWTVKYSDACVVNTTVTLATSAKLNIIRDGAGSFSVTTGGLIQALSGAVILRPGSNVLVDSTANGAVFNTL